MAVGIEMQTVEELRFTENAFGRVKDILSKPESVGKALRVMVLGGGCAGLEYSMALGFEKEDDKVIEHDGYKIVIDPKSLSFLKGGTVDFYDSIQSSGFKFINPNATATCGCGISFRTTQKTEMAKAKPCH